MRPRPDPPARLLPHRFNRHTFWCGQSGSGKTYALGVLIEQLLAQTDLPIVIFDPNADFVRLGEVRADAAPGDAAALRNREIRVLRPGNGPGEHLRVRFRSLPLPVKAAMLRLDPLRDRAEYNSVLHLDAFQAESDPGALLARLQQFRQGEALFAGGFVPAPSLVQVRDRITEEGGIDVRVPLR